MLKTVVVVISAILIGVVTGFETIKILVSNDGYDATDDDPKEGGTSGIDGAVEE